VSGRIVGRAVLLLIAAAVVGIAALQLRALGLREDGERTLATVGPRTSQSAVLAATSDLQRARRFSADPTARLDEAELLLKVGRTLAAARLLEPVMRRNPGSIRGWSLLARATAGTNPRRHAAARARLLAFYGRLPRPSVATPTLRTPDGRVLTVIPKRVQGYIDASTVGLRSVSLRGWAGLVRANQAADEVVVVSRGRVVVTTAPSLARPDLARHFGTGFGRAGFLVRIPRVALERDGKLDVTVYAVEGQVASAMAFFCKGRRQVIGC
jgi:hypothetical protein